MVEERVRENGNDKGKRETGADRTRRLATGEKRKCAAGAIGGKGEKRRETERKGHWRERRKGAENFRGGILQGKAEKRRGNAWKAWLG